MGVLRGESVRQFASEDLPRERIAELLDALKCVPTGCNARNLTFRVIASRARLDELRSRMVELLLTKEAELPEFLKAPVAAVRRDPGLDPFFRHAPHLACRRSATPGRSAVATAHTSSSSNGRRVCRLADACICPWYMR